MNILEAKNLSYNYANSKEKVLSSVNQGFEEGEFYAIIGKSGAGKSTFLSLLAGLDSPQGGEILFRGENIEKEGYSKHRRDNISLVFQNYNLIEYLTPLENIRLVNKHASEDILLELGLDISQIKRNVLKLSGGQQQRVAIARSMINNPEIILADEPTGNLDTETSLVINNLFKKINEEKKQSIIIVTHSLELANLAEYKYKIEKGEFNKVL